MKLWLKPYDVIRGNTGGETPAEDAEMPLCGSGEGTTFKIMNGCTILHLAF